MLDARSSALYRPLEFLRRRWPHALFAENIKMRIFPGDDVSTNSVEAMLRELSSSALIDIYEVDGRKYLQVAGWANQRIDRPTFQFPDRNGASAPMAW
jgi:hypothetical protein